MARLSQKAWNNVIIFAMLAMIVVLNIGNLQSDDEALPFPIIGEGELILSLEIDQFTIERAGTSWRLDTESLQLLNSESPDAVSNQLGRKIAPPEAGQLATVIDYWQRALVKRQTEVTTDMLSTPDHIVVLWLAGERNGKVIPIKVIDQKAYVLMNNEALLVDFPTLSQLTQW